ncbi:phosphoribosylglycinamide formyltransferase [Streptomyces viridosporus ATCC 14672]|uniref:Phosphoribosylglycinamide formyltransferase n=1 Tax=Streptomyces viridosporus (strain ATCC 14672 / DSM 40746 / JCM 4963 / KCTC 9882 / NRRL B-12104 / FH 1290) TaxID=566461 RepID=D6A359_STRV1|nr:phosphoribosylglycinamide formyltransferase [Streptomyces viridosporus ATCC 14672]
MGAARCAGIVADGRPLRRLPRIRGREAFGRRHKALCRRPHGRSPRKGPTVAAKPVAERARRLVVLVSGSGTNLQALLDEIAATGAEAYGAEVVAVGADREGIEGLARAERAGLATFVCKVGDHATREEWDAALTDAVAAHEPDLVVSAGFMKIVGERFLARFGGRFVNTHPALLPSFPGAHGVRDALAYGAKVTGCTVHFVDDGVDTGPIIAQGVVEVRDEDDESALHERIKEVERRLLVEVVGRLARNGYRIEGRKVVIQ